MSDRHHSHANGRRDPADLPAGELAAWWDRRTGRRRIGSTDTDSQTDTETSGTTATVVAGLEALSRADDLSAPRPGFLDHLERHLMDAPIAVLPPAKPSPVREAIPPVLAPRSARRGRGLIDILTVAAVVALLLGGSWSVLNDRATAPTPSGAKGVAGATTPESTPVPTGPLVVELDTFGVTTLTNHQLAGLRSVETATCTTEPREPGSVLSAFQSRGTETDGVSDLLNAGSPVPNMGQGPPVADSDDAAAAVALFEQLTACRFATGDRSTGTTEPWAQPYWNLFSDDYLLETIDVDEEAGIERSVQSAYLISEPQNLGPFPFEVGMVEDVSQPGQSDRLLRVNLRDAQLNQPTWLQSPASMTAILREQAGVWRIAALTRDEGATESIRALPLQVVDVSVSSNMTVQDSLGRLDYELVPERPIAVTIFVAGEYAQDVTVGDETYVVASGESLRVSPFSVSNAAVEAAGGSFSLPVTARTVGATWTPTEVVPPVTIASTAPRPATPAAEHATPTADPASTPTAGAVALDRPWAENLSGSAINGVWPVNTTECVTPSRPAGSVETALEERLALGDAAPSTEPEFIADAAIDPATYPPASDTEVAAATAFFQQLSACRFEPGDRVGTTVAPYNGAYWDLFSDEYFADSIDDVLRLGGPEHAVRSAYSSSGAFIAGWSYPATVLDVRRVPPDAEGRARLLVTSTGSEAVEFQQVSLLVEEEGRWRFLSPSLVSPEPPLTLSAQVADIVLGSDAYGPRGTGNFPSQLEAGYPVSMTVANVGETPQQVTVTGQDLGIVQPGASIVLQPFEISPEAVAAAGGRLTFTIESVDLDPAADAPEPRPLTVAVYPAGSLEYGQIARAARTPMAEPVVAATPGVAASPETTEWSETPVSVAVAAEPDQVVEIDQPWAVSTGSEEFDGVDPVSAADCTMEPRASGALIALVETASIRPVAELPEYLTDADLATLTSRYPAASPADLAIAQGFLDQWSACRYVVGSADVPFEDRYTGPAWSLLSNDSCCGRFRKGRGARPSPSFGSSVHYSTFRSGVPTQIRSSTSGPVPPMGSASHGCWSFTGSSPRGTGPRSA